ncbi:MAG: hypothetical protein Q8Q31_03565 [Nanoarchaeota archaeon]|nr:hypothetical protein [Nanoarchaeota archaeon]
MRGYDILGNIALVKFQRGESAKSKRQQAEQLIKNNKRITTVLEKKDKIKGRLRTPKTSHIAGLKTKEVLYRENNSLFRFNIDTCYFSPRLANERKEIASMVKKGESVLILFGGVGPFAITIAKTGKPKRIISMELGRECCKYALENVKRNKVEVEIIQGDVRKKLPSLQGKFDRIVMARPNLQDSFLDVVFPKINKSGTVHYYGFYKEESLGVLRELIESKAKEAGKRIRILKIKRAGDIGVREYRYRADFKVLN